MSSALIIFVKQNTQKPDTSPDTVVADMATLRGWLKTKKIFRHLFHYREAQGFTYDVQTLIKPLGFALLLRLFSYGKCVIIDQSGHCQPVTFGYLVGLARNWIDDFFRQGAVIKEVERSLQQLGAPNQQSQKVALTLANPTVYLRTDLVFGLQSGGSVGHIAGVLNQLDEFCGKSLLLTTGLIPTVRADIAQVQIWPDQRFREFPELRPLAFNRTFYQQALNHLQAQKFAFIYQRYSVNNFAGLKLARKLQIPFVLEFNGPEVWVNRHWGRPLKYEALAERIELANLHGADVVTVVSQPLQDELVARGIDPAKILVNPNGVNTERYSPTVDGSEVRRRYELADKIVIGFIGTFGPWHGAEVLAEAYGRLLQEYPAYRQQVHLLMIGDGVTMPQVKANLAKYGAQDACTLTGLVSQAQGPAHLAACDLLASPHVPNADGTPFFGSPTKLFEYMAMGKGIVASNLDQIGEILEHGRTAWLVEPKKPEALMAGLRQLIDDMDLRQRLGQAARAEAVAKYTWREHTRRIIAHLVSRTK